MKPLRFRVVAAFILAMAIPSVGLAGGTGRQARLSIASGYLGGPAVGKIEGKLGDLLDLYGPFLSRLDAFGTGLLDKELDADLSGPAVWLDAELPLWDYATIEEGSFFAFFDLSAEDPVGERDVPYHFGEHSIIADYFTLKLSEQVRVAPVFTATTTNGETEGTEFYGVGPRVIVESANERNGWFIIRQDILFSDRAVFAGRIQAGFQSFLFNVDWLSGPAIDFRYLRDSEGWDGYHQLLVYPFEIQLWDYGTIAPFFAYRSDDFTIKPLQYVKGSEIRGIEKILRDVGVTENDEMPTSFSGLGGGAWFEIHFVMP